MSAGRAGFSDRVIHWQQAHGRHDLPWQATRDPYRVWLSEIMLQQTQVSTVLDYYARFLQRFPDVASLAAAPLEDVLGLWSGLGYYSRARHLHRAAQEVMARFGGRLPSTAAELQTLPGIGRSTAAAIAAFCFGERAAILDGNVKRVLTRALGFDGDLSLASNERALWQLVESLLPTGDLTHTMPSYTQGLMDLGATVCTRRQPACTVCPLVNDCVAAREGRQAHYPVKTKRLTRKRVAWWLLHAVDGHGRVWLTQRADSGIWARMHSLPVYPSREDLLAMLPATCSAASVVEHASFLHVLTHRDLELHVVTARLPAASLTDGDGRWFDASEWPALGLPAPIRRFLQGQ